MTYTKLSRLGGTYVKRRGLLQLAFCLGAVACSNNTSTTDTSYLVGGTVSGLKGSVVLANNTADNITVTTNGAFSFPTQVKSGSAFSVTVVTQPTGQTCTLTNTTGTIGTQNITSVVVTCADIVNAASLYSVGGSVSGLASGSLILQNHTDQVTVTASGAFTFPTQEATGTAYAVAVTSAPAGVSCTVSNGSGQVAGANVTTVAVTCTPIAYTVSGTVSGASGPFVIANNSNTLSIANAQTSFSFANLHHGDTYNITVNTPPTGQTCTAAGGAGTLALANVSNVVITCMTTTYSVSGTIVGASGPIVLSNNGTNPVAVDGNNFSVAGLVPSDTYSIAVDTAPTGQTCAVSTPYSGTIAAADVSGIVVTCTNIPTYSVSGTVSGATDVITLANGATTVTVAATDSTFEFGGLAGDANYNITVSAAPTGETCSVASGAGNIQNANHTDVVVTCSSFNVAGTISGSSNGLILAQVNKTSTTLVQFAADTNTFLFDGYLTTDAYEISVYASSNSSACTLTGDASGTIQNSNITNLVVTCVPKTFSVSGVYANPAANDPNLIVTIGTATATLNSSTQGFQITGLADGTAFTVQTTPPGNKTCTVQPGSSYTISNANIAGLVITCN